MRRLTAACVVLVASAAGLPVQATAATCSKGGARTLKANDVVRVYAERGGAVRACWRRTGRSVTLSDGSLKVDVAGVRDHRVLYTLDDTGDDRSGGPYLFVQIMDVRRRRLTVDAVGWRFQSSTNGGGQMADLLFAGTGVAWIARNGRFPEEPWEVYYAPSGTTGNRQPTKLGGAAEIEIGSLAAGSRYVYWVAGTTPARAAFR